MGYNYKNIIDESYKSNYEIREQWKPRWNVCFTRLIGIFPKLAQE